MIKPTQRQNQIMDFVSKFQSENNSIPTYAQIGQELGITSRAGVHGHIRRMEKKQLLVLPENPRKRLSVYGKV
jgi:SOS-response transcriptional repressor LexA